MTFSVCCCCSSQVLRPAACPWLALRPTQDFTMFSFQTFFKGLGQLEAYLGVDEGVAFQMDNDLYWDSLGTGLLWPIEGLTQKKMSSKFWVTQLPCKKVVLQNWTGMYLAPVDLGRDPKAFPVQLFPYSDNPNLKFEVFYKDNRVAFQSYNGLFLGRLHRVMNVLEATMFFPDESCFFCPLIGDLDPPAFAIVSVIPRKSEVHYVSLFVQRQVFVNWKEEPERHVFALTWKTKCTDRIYWDRLWGLGMASSCCFSVGDAKPTVVYSQDNEHTVSVERDISETVIEEVMVPPMTRARADLWVDKQSEAAVPFTADVHKLKADGSLMVFKEVGAWRGLVFRNVQLKIKFTKL